MSAAKPTLVIVHGGWHIPESYEKLVGALETAGYEVHCPRLPSTNQVWRTLLDLDAASLAAAASSTEQPSIPCRLTQ